MEPVICAQGSYSTPKRKVLGDISNENDDSPISPMANLRLLTKVATSPVNTDIRQGVTTITPSFDSRTTEEDALPIKKKFGCGYVRKTKSLGFLCNKFLKLFPLDIAQGQSTVISLNHVANELGVEKRRIYDIINIVECLAMANKIGKDTYAWLGNTNLSRTMGLFNEYATHIGLDSIVKAAQEGQSLNADMYRDLFKEDSSPHFKSLTTCLLDERRIGVLCQKFVMLLIVSHQQNLLVSLDAAAAILVGEPELGKTRYRRLYDIANILQTLTVIRRIEPNNSTVLFKKPVYTYSGPPIEKTSLSLCCCNGSCTTVANHTEEDRFTAVKMEFQADDSSSSDCPSPKRSLSPVAKVKSVAKKRLLFRQEMKGSPANNVIHKSFDLVCKQSAKMAPSAAKVRLEPGALYKAVKTGSGIQLIKLH